MKPTITFTAYGDPKGQPRARAYRRGARAGVYDPGTADAWKAAIRDAARWCAKPGHFAGCPVKVTLNFLFRRPKSHYRTVAGEPVLRDRAPLWHTQKPDRDNLEKAVLDALTSTGIWDDDSQVCCGEVSKMWSDRVPCCIVEIREATLP